MNALDGTTGLAAAIERVAPVDVGEGLSSGPIGAPSFSEVLSSAVQHVDQLQQHADAEAGRVALGGGNLHETALALEKADVGMRVMVKARNKLVEAYQEIMRMNV